MRHQIEQINGSAHSHRKDGPGHSKVAALASVPQRQQLDPARRDRLQLDESVTTRPNMLSLPNGLTLTRWREIGEQIYRISNSSAWWLGDWLLYGERAYPDRYKRAVEGTMLDHQTLRNYAWVARRFDPSRRRDKLSVQHHVEVAALSAEEQDAWLDRAERFGLSRNKLRAMLKTDRDVKAGDAELAQFAFRLNISPEQKKQWQEAAERASRSLAEWMAAALDEAARDVPRISEAE